MKYSFFRKSVLFLGDAALLVISLYAALFLRWQQIISLRVFLHFGKQFFWLFLFWIFLLFIFDFYSLEIRFKSYDFLKYFLIFIFLILFSGVLYFYIFSAYGKFPRAVFFLNIIIFCSFFVLWRLFFEWSFGKSRIKENIIFWGNFPERSFLVSYIKNSNYLYKISEIFNSSVSVNKILKTIKEKKIKRIILSPDVKDFQKIFFSFPEVEIESAFDFYERVTKRISLASLKDPIFLENFLKKEDNLYVIAKRIFDLTISFLGILVLILIFPFIALAIKLDSPGPVFFVQKRIGKNEKVFNSIKFRSMYVRKNSKKIWREKDKAEITAVGKFLRMTHIDELPQFINILKGDMSIVGPRTEWVKLVRMYEEAIPFYFLRHKAKPGFTGWAQLNYPPSTSVKEAKEKLEYDLYYIKNRSFLFDIIIFLKSLRKIFG